MLLLKQAFQLLFHLIKRTKLSSHNGASLTSVIASGDDPEDVAKLSFS